MTPPPEIEQTVPLYTQEQLDAAVTAAVAAERQRCHKALTAVAQSFAPRTLATALANAWMAALTEGD